jgi:hypothetical protein
MPLNTDAMSDRAVGESIETGEKKNAPAQCSTGRTNFRAIDQATAPKLAFRTVVCPTSTRLASPYQAHRLSIFTVTRQSAGRHSDRVYAVASDREEK